MTPRGRIIFEKDGKKMMLVPARKNAKSNEAYRQFVEALSILKKGGNK